MTRKKYFKVKSYYHPSKQILTQMKYCILFFLQLSASTTFFQNYQRLPNELFDNYPELNPFNHPDKYTDALIYCLVNENKHLNYKIDDWKSKTASWNYQIDESDYTRRAKECSLKDFFKKNCVDYITTAIALWKINGAMSLLVAYEIHRFQAGFDYDFTKIKNLQTFKWASQKGYIKNKSDKKQFEKLFTEKIKYLCNNHVFGCLIIAPRGLAIPTPTPYNKKGIQYSYENGNLKLQNDSIEYTFKHNSDSLKLISSKNIETQLTKTPWSRSGNIGTSFYAHMCGTEAVEHYGFTIFPASIGCYRDIILNYSDDKSLFYGFAIMGQLYFFYGHLPKKQSEQESFCLKEFFLLHEMIYYKNHVSLAHLRLLRLLPMSRINKIASQKPYLKHIADTLNNTDDPVNQENRMHARIILYIITFWFIAKTKGQYLVSSIFLIFLSLTVYLLSHPNKYTNLYIWCGWQ